MKITVHPAAFPCPLWACPPGLFLCGTTLGFKSEYRTRGRLVVTPCKILIDIEV